MTNKNINDRSDTSNILELKNLTKRYRNFALEDVSLKLP